MQTENVDILIVDDDKDVQEMIQSVLNFYGYKVKLCNNENDISNFIEHYRPRAILMDMLLSGSDGRDICRGIKTNMETNSIPVIMISAHPDARESCKLAGADEFVEKPFEIKTLLNKIHQFLD